MAKVKAPLLSMEARGQLAKQVVHFPWKGINAVREYVIPANPKTQGQRDQRTHLTAAVTEWHAAAYTAADATAWNRLAGIAAKIMSGFNRMVQEHVKEAISGNTWERMTNVFTDGVLSTGFNVMVTKTGGGNAPTCRYGVRKTHFPDTVAMADQGGDVWAVTLAALTPNTLFYFTIDIGATGTDWGRVGIYQQRTLAA